MQELAKFLILTGGILVLCGLILYLLPHASQIPWLNKLGQLPGDISVRRENFRFYFPLGTSLVLSVVFSLIFYVLQRWKR